MQLRKLRDPGIPRRRVELGDVRVRGQRSDDRMLPTAPANDKYSHVPGAYPLPRYSSGKRGERGARRGRAASVGRPVGLTGRPT